MAGTDQMKPLANAVDRSSSDEDDPRWHSAKKLSRKQSFFICCSATTVVIIVIVIVTLIYTVFKVKKPEIAMNSVRIDSMKVNYGGGGVPPLTLNLTLIADVSVKNPNSAAFRFDNSTTLLFYRGKTVGEAHNPAGKASARRTLRMNVTIDVDGDQLANVTNLLTSDVASGALTVNSYTSIGGRVKFLSLINRHADVVLNCTVIVSVSNQTIQSQACNSTVTL